MLTLPSSMKLGTMKPHPEQICVQLLRENASARMKVEVFKEEEKYYNMFETLMAPISSKVGEKCFFAPFPDFLILLQKVLKIIA